MNCRRYQSDGFLMDKRPQSNPFNQLVPYRSYQQSQRDKFQELNRFMRQNRYHEQAKYQSKQSGDNDSIGKIIILLGIIFVVALVFKQDCPFQDESKIRNQCKYNYQKLECFNSTAIEKRNRHQCTDLQKCLKNPLDFKSDLESRQWKKFIQQLQDVFGELKEKFLWICGLILAVLTVIRARSIRF